MMCRGNQVWDKCMGYVGICKNALGLAPYDQNVIGVNLCLSNCYTLYIMHLLDRNV